MKCDLHDCDAADGLLLATLAAVVAAHMVSHQRYMAAPVLAAA